MSCSEFRYCLGQMECEDYCLVLEDSLIRYWNGCLVKLLVGKHAAVTSPIYKSKLEWSIQWRRRTVKYWCWTLFFLHFDSIKRVLKDKNTSSLLPYYNIYIDLTSIRRVEGTVGERCRTVLDHWDPPLRIQTQTYIDSSSSCDFPFGEPFCHSKSQTRRMIVCYRLICIGWANDC